MHLPSIGLFVSLAAVAGSVRPLEAQEFTAMRGVVESGARLFCVAATADHGAELWASDAAQKKVALVRDIRPGAAASGIGVLLPLNGGVLFAADDGEHGRELWFSDGTAAGTKMAGELGAGAKGCRLDLARGALVSGGHAFVVADARRLVRTDGRKLTQLADLGAVASGHDFGMTALRAGVVVLRSRRLWVSDGTASGTRPLSDAVLVQAGPFVRSKSGRLVFAATVQGKGEGEDKGHGNGSGETTWDLWVSDGTAKGTRPLHGAPAAAAVAGGLPGPGPTAKELKLAKMQFLTYCVTCHGKSGQGDGPAAIALTPKPRNWTDPAWQKAVTDKRIFDVIKDGGARHGLSPLMAPNPQYQDKPGVLQALVRMVRRFDKTRK